MIPGSLIGRARSRKDRGAGFESRSWILLATLDHIQSWVLLATSGVHEVFVALETERLCKFVSLVMFVPGEHDKVVLFRRNLLIKLN